MRRRLRERQWQRRRLLLLSRHAIADWKRDGSGGAGRKQDRSRRIVDDDGRRLETGACNSLAICATSFACSPTVRVPGITGVAPETEVLSVMASSWRLREEKRFKEGSILIICRWA